ncbi:hypothetical protein [Bradyrhizobium canariense]|uniref:Uncharacterized protein n=1 Tax=Bradyrhizobium canariense TaxID=255045 RepID=A0A1H2BMU5_9BRAD|nr:hypothetical protein [Bradyrhizobium canariense]SDT59382.1 hypothetical protein SAMN05444158_7339 [Bradyrhizobium canariense]
MKKYSKLFIATIFCALATGAAADTFSCKECDPHGQESSHLEQIKVDRAKYDRENDKGQESSHREQIKTDRAKYDLENDPDQASSHREKIKADRAKYDRENEKLVARPWDALKSDKPLPEKIN